MALSIKDEKADRLAREIARRTGESLTEAVTRALEERLRRLPKRKPRPRLADELDELALRIAAAAGDDPRTPEEIIGYDEQGLPR